MEELFKPGRLQLFFHTLPFGSIVLSQSRGQNAPPLTQRVATLSPEAPAPVPIARMTVGSRRELDDLVGRKIFFFAFFLLFRLVVPLCLSIVSCFSRHLF